MGKLGRVIGFSAEASLWIAGAALVAGSVGMHWNVDLPKVDLSGLVPANATPAASAGHGAGSPTPALSKTPPANPELPSHSASPGSSR